MHLVPWASRYLGNNSPNLGAIKGILPKSVSYRGQIPRRTQSVASNRLRNGDHTKVVRGDPRPHRTTRFAATGGRSVQRVGA